MRKPRDSPDTGTGRQSPWWRCWTAKDQQAENRSSRTHFSGCLQGPPPATPIPLLSADTRRARSRVPGWRKIDSCSSSNLPVILLGCSPRCPHKITVLIRHNANFPSILVADVSTPRTTASLHRRLSIHVWVSTTGDALIGCHVFQHRLTGVGYHDCPHSTFP